MHDAENPETGWGEYDAAVYLLRTPLIAARTASAIREREIDWDGLFKAMRPWSSGEQLLVRAAFSLWQGRSNRESDDRVTLGELVWTLDSDNAERLIEAIRIYCKLGVAA